MKRILTMVIALLICAATANAQFLKKLKDKINDAAKKSVDRAVDKTIDKTVAKPIEKQTDKVLEGKTGGNAKPGSGIKTHKSTSEVDFIVEGNEPPKMGAPCVSKEAVAQLPGIYLTAAQYPWPAARAEYFKKITNSNEKSIAQHTVSSIEKLEQQSRTNFTLAGGFWQATYGTEGYNYLGNLRLADYRFQAAFYTYLCIDNKVRRNDEFSTVLRVYVNTLPINSLAKYLKPIARAKDISGSPYAYKDWKNYKAGAVLPTIAIMNYLESSDEDLIAKINNGDNYWQDTPQAEINENSHDHISRYWFVKKNNEPILIPVSRKEYLESLLEYYDREAMYLPKSTNYELGSKEQRQTYFGDLTAVLGNKKAIVSKLLKEKEQKWLAKQAIINTQEDEYLTQKLQSPEYSSKLTFHKFYDGEVGGVRLYKYNPAYFSSEKPNAADPMFMAIAFRYVHMPAHLRILNNFTNKFDVTAWQKLLKM